MGKKDTDPKAAVSGGDAAQPPKRRRTLEEVATVRLRRLIREVTEAGGGNGIYDLVMDSVERPLLIEALRASGGNQVQAAKLLGINRNTLRRKIDKLGIKL